MQFQLFQVVTSLVVFVKFLFLADKRPAHVWVDMTFLFALLDSGSSALPNLFLSSLSYKNGMG